jgi:hypothetical protein
MKCFNADLASHQRFCVTTGIHVQPKGASPNGEKKEKVRILPAKKPTPPTPPKAKVNCPPPSQSPPVESDSESSESEESESSETTLDVSKPGSEDKSLYELSSYGGDDLSVSEQPEEHIENDAVQEEEIPEEILQQIRIKGRAGYVFTREEFNREIVKLRQCQMEKREYTWTVPEWILNSPLRRTERGSIIMSKGGLESPITNISQTIKKNDPKVDKRKS